MGHFSIVAGLGLMVAGFVLAAEHEIPVAPKDYLEMKSPVQESPEVLEKGARIYARTCKKCHGRKGLGGKGYDSGGAGASEIKPPDFTASGYLKGRADGQLFFIIEKGSVNTDMGAHGLGSETNLSNDDIWNTILFLRKSFAK